MPAAFMPLAMPLLRAAPALYSIAAIAAASREL